MAAPLASIFNSSLREGMLPELWKTANIVPIPKKSPPTVVEKDVCPISLTLIVSKVFESMVLKWVDHVIRPKLEPRQFGSISRTCTTDALVEMVHQWYEATDTRQTCVRILLLDYSKAFDLINHEILMQKLVDIGIPPHIVRWMAAFLLNRRHIVKIGNITFLVHINDLTTPCPMYKYVDDSTIFEICDAETVSILQESAEVAMEWSNNNDMKINASKTHELLIDFSKDKVFSALPNITMSGVEIQRTKSAKILGVTISDDFSWNIHVDNIVSKASKRVYMLYQLKRSGINQADLLSIYASDPPSS